MIDLAKKRTRRTRSGGWMKRSLPVVYDQALEVYEMECRQWLGRLSRIRPADPWLRWRLVEAAFFTGMTRDWIELLAGLKWPVDFLVREGFVVDDSPRELEEPPTNVTQQIDRKWPRVEIVIEPAGEMAAHAERSGIVVPN